MCYKVSALYPFAAKLNFGCVSTRLLRGFPSHLLSPLMWNDEVSARGLRLVTYCSIHTHLSTCTERMGNDCKCKLPLRGTAVGNGVGVQKRWYRLVWPSERVHDPVHVQMLSELTVHEHTFQNESSLFISCSHSRNPYFYITVILELRVARWDLMNVISKRSHTI